MELLLMYYGFTEEAASIYHIYIYYGSSITHTHTHTHIRNVFNTDRHKDAEQVQGCESPMMQ